MSNEIANIASSIKSKAGFVDKEINGKRYTIKLLPARNGIVIGTQLIKTFLPALAAYADGAKKSQLVMPEDDNIWTSVAMLLVNQMDKINVLDIIDILLENLSENGSSVKWDDAFVGNYSGLLQIIEFTMKENFGDFFTNYLSQKGINLDSLTQFGTQV
jgi:hypothetical protein